MSSLRQSTAYALSVLAVASAVLVSAELAEAALPGRNGPIVFSSDRDGDFEIFRIETNGKGLRKLTSNHTWDECPAWSPDARKITFSRLRAYGSDLWVMRADGSRARRLLRAPRYAYDSCPSWSPSGRWIAFTRDESYSTDVWIVRADGRRLRRLTTDLGSARPSWSARGAIATQTTNDLAMRRIESMWSDGSHIRRLTGIETSWNSDPNWAPGGKRLVFSGEEAGNWIDQELFIVSADGSGLRQLTDHALWDVNPAWSPNGRRIIYVTATQEGNRDLHLIRPDGSAKKRLTSARGSDLDPDWARRP